MFRNLKRGKLIRNNNSLSTILAVPIGIENSVFWHFSQFKQLDLTVVFGSLVLAIIYNTSIVT